MSTFLVNPPPYHNRMQFMDSLEETGIDYSREPDGYYVYLRIGQEDLLQKICSRFEAVIVAENPINAIDA